MADGKWNERDRTGQDRTGQKHGAFAFVRSCERFINYLGKKFLNTRNYDEIKSIHEIINNEMKITLCDCGQSDPNLIINQ